MENITELINEMNQTIPGENQVFVDKRERIMTTKEAQEYLKDKKVYVGKYSKEIQEKLFKIGFIWRGGDKKVKYIEIPFIFTGFDGKDYFLTHSSDVNFFSFQSDAEEITAEEILAIEIEEEPHQFKPFDRVLFRIDCENDFWRAGLYSHRCNSSHYILGYGYVSAGNVIPYEGNEDKLGKITD